MSGPSIGRDAAAALIEPLTDLVVRAGAAILAVNRGAMQIDGKADGSPVTEADLAADRIICEGLAALVPDIPAISEERVDLAKPPYDGSFFLIDPLDGTKEFVAGRNEFTVNLALVSNGTPLLGIIGAPALGLIWRGLVGHGAERLTIGNGAVTRAEPIRTRPIPPAGAPWLVAVSRSHGDAKRKPLLTRDPARSGRSWDPQSSSAGSPKASPISIPASRRPANGISRRATPSSPRPAAGSRMGKAPICSSAKADPTSSCRSSLPGAIRERADALLY